MKKEELSDALNLLPDQLIQETDGLRGEGKRPRRHWRRWCALAACLALAAAAGARLIPGEEPGAQLPELPMLTVTQWTTGGMGDEGFAAYHVSQLVNGNPWSEEATLTTLPVYENLHRMAPDESYPEENVDFAQMEDILRRLARGLGLDGDSLEVTTQDDPENEYSPATVTAQADGIRLEVDQTMTGKIELTPPVPLPEGYNGSEYAPYGDVAAAADYWKETYRALLGMDDPQVNIYGGDYDIWLQQSYHIEFYDNADTLTQRIINYNFNRMWFGTDETGALVIVWAYRPDLSKKLGDYPIITAQEATRLLGEGKYILPDYGEMPGLEYVAKVELVYRTGEAEAYDMPYYRFLVENPDSQWDLGDDAIKEYDAYYVPAVEGAYLSNFTA